MANTHPFYRFETGWNAGFYPDNQIVSDLLNEVYVAVTAAFPTISVVGTTTFSQLKSAVNSIVSNYNVSPYFGNFVVTGTLIFVGPDYTFVISVKDDALYATDNTQEFTITGTATGSGKVLITSLLNAFAPGTYTGTFDAPLIATEQKVKEALSVVEYNGSAFFPITYSFDSTTNVATSGLARGKDWKLDAGVIDRFPAPTNPYENQRTFQLPQLTGDDSYVLSIMERIIQSSFTDPLLLEGLDIYNQLAANPPDGWTTNYNAPVPITYVRYQFNFINTGRRAFTLVGRKDTTWLWQRFVTDTATPYDFLTNYTESTALPYEPNQAGRWLYQNETYDLEFVEFTSGCYQSNEFYPMPAKPGDQLQFNIVDANLEGIDSVDVGLFTESGDFVQKIGEAVIEPVTFELTGFYWTPSTSIIGYSQWWDVYDDLEWDQPEIRFQLVSCTGELIGSVLGTIPATTLTTNDRQLFINAFDAIEWPDIVQSASVSIASQSSPATFTFTLSSSEQCSCGVQMMMTNNDDEEYLFIDPADLTTSYPLKTQHQASVTIPSKQGCYRMGVYKKPGEQPPQSTNCTIDFQFAYNEVDTEEFIYAVNGLVGNVNPYVRFSLGTSIYVYTVSSIVTGTEFVAWVNATIPGMVAAYDEEGPYISFVWTKEIECESEEVFQVCHGDESTIYNEEYPWFKTEAACCPCEPHCESTFSITNIEGCDPFLMLNDYPTGFVGLFLTTDNSPFENKTCLYKFPIADIYPVDPSCGPIIEIANWLDTIPGVSTSLVIPDCAEYPCDTNLSITWTANVPCDTNLKMVFAAVDVSDSLLEIIANTEFQSCVCPPSPGADTFYGLYSLSNIINIDASDCFSTMLEFWADSNQIAQGFEYFDNWKQRIRIGLNGGGEKPIIEESLYRQSNGVHRRPQNKQDLSIDLHTDFFDLDTQLAMTDATRHPYFVWNGQSVFVKGDLEVATIQDFTNETSFETLSQMKFQVLKQGFQPKNSSCLNC